MLIRHSNGDIEKAAEQVSLELKNSGPVCDKTFQNQQQQRWSLTPRKNEAMKQRAQDNTVLSQSLPPPPFSSSSSLTPTYPPTLLWDFSAGNDPYLNSPQIVPILSPGTRMAPTRFVFHYNYVLALSPLVALQTRVTPGSFCTVYSVCLETYFLSQSLLSPQHFIWPTFDHWMGP